MTEIDDTLEMLERRVLAGVEDLECCLTSICRLHKVRLRLGPEMAQFVAEGTVPPWVLGD